MSMQAISAINRKISDTENQVKLIQETGDPNSILTQLSISELERRLENLRNEKSKIYNAQAKETVSIRIYGDNVETGKISNRTLISVLSGFQSMIEGIASVIDGSLASRGKITDKARMLTDFKVTETFAGSFGIKLEKDFEQMEMVSNSSDTGQIVSEFFDILECGENPERLVYNISPFGKRTVVHYREWLNQIKENAINLEINWLDDSAEFRSLNIKYPHTDSIIFTLDSIEEIINEEVIAKGILTGLNIRQNTFELKTDEGIIKGNSLFETLVSISHMINQEITVKLIKSNSQLKSMVSKTSWYLVGLYNNENG